MSNTEVDIARILKASTSPVGIKYKFGIQVHKGIKNEIDKIKRMETSYSKKIIRQVLSNLLTIRHS
jgi:hypothetical protein